MPVSLSEEFIAVYRWTALDQVPADFGPTVVTIGNFDGVHRGHRAVLERLVQATHADGRSAVAVTFWPHPVAVLHPERAPQLICGLEDRLDLLESTGLDATLALEFTLELAHHSPEDFVRVFFVEGLRASTVVVGQDVRFGWRNEGDINTMIALGEKYGFHVVTIDDISSAGTAIGQQMEERRWSSSWVRELLAIGDVAHANEVLGRLHAVRGTVVHGDARGRELGFPTANLGQDAEGMIPGDGVYAGWLRRLAPDSAVGESGEDTSVRLPAAISVGTNPTFDGAERRVEAYVLDRTNLDLYGEEVALDFEHQLRPTLKFDGIESLVAQMNVDVEDCRRLLGV